jgi:uncharacterized protein YdeI (YjbR/CyaY-like superfamily)
VTEELYVTDRNEWRSWLEQNHSIKKVDLVFYKKNSGRSSIPYEDSVEEALCFGWVDSTIRKVDEEKYVRRFTPRKGKSVWSELNKKRAKKMIKQERMTEAGLESIREAKQNGSWTKTPESRMKFEIPPFMREALVRNKKALQNFDGLAPMYKRHFIGWVASAKKEETRRKRLEEALSLLEQNKKLGLK